VSCAFPVMAHILLAPGCTASDAELQRAWAAAAAVVIRADSSHLPANSADAVTILGATKRSALLAEALRLLKPGGACTVHELAPSAPEAFVPNAAVTVEETKRAILFAGLADAQVATPPSGNGSAGATQARVQSLVEAIHPALVAMSLGQGAPAHEAKDALLALEAAAASACAVLTAEAKRPSYSPGEVFSLRSRTPVASQPTPTPTAQQQANADPAAAWAQAATKAAEATDLMDEDELLDSMDAAVPERPGADKCTPQTRKKACANCSCGLKELEEAEANKAPPPKSNCGSCGLGDAFRCEGCPYRGMPAFKPGEEVKLAASMFDKVGSSAPEGAAEAPTARGDGGVVKLDAAMLDADDF